ncbi:MAG: DUF4411 family protein [Candidatus Thorarchaeota archaeon]
MKYSFDTSGFLNPWKHFYSPKLFPRLWNTLDGLIQSGLIVATQMIIDELEDYDDEVLKWVRDRRKNLIIDVDSDQEALVDMMVNNPELEGFVDTNSTSDQADPYVVALAMKYKLIVVTDEKRPKKGRIKIPDVCRYYDVECIDFQTFLSQIGYTDQK